MVHTLPDYTTKYKMVEIFGSIDDAELAARLGSVMIQNRSGNLYFYDPFEADRGIWTTSGTTGYAAVYDAGIFLTGATSLRLKTGSISNGNVNYLCRIPWLPVSKLGFEVSFTMPANMNIFKLDICIYDGTNKYHAFFRDNENAGYIDIYAEPTDVIHLDTTTKLYRSQYVFHTAKLIIDTSTGYYVRLIINHTTYNCSAYQMDVSADATTKPHIAIYVDATNDATPNAYMNVDNLIVTRNEV